MPAGRENFAGRKRLRGALLLEKLVAVLLVIRLKQPAHRLPCSTPDSNSALSWWKRISVQVSEWLGRCQRHLWTNIMPKDAIQWLQMRLSSTMQLKHYALRAKQPYYMLNMLCRQAKLQASYAMD